MQRRSLHKAEFAQRSTSGRVDGASLHNGAPVRVTAAIFAENFPPSRTAGQRPLDIPLLTPLSPVLQDNTAVAASGCNNRKLRKELRLHSLEPVRVTNLIGRAPKLVLEARSVTAPFLPYSM